MDSDAIESDIRYLMDLGTKAIDFLTLHDARLTALEQLMMDLHPDGREAVAARLLEARRTVEGASKPAPERTA